MGFKQEVYDQAAKFISNNCRELSRGDVQDLINRHRQPDPETTIRAVAMELDGRDLMTVKEVMSLYEDAYQTAEAKQESPDIEDHVPSLNEDGTTDEDAPEFG